MQKQLVVTVIGADKPGIVESLADTITRQQGNWLASSMSELAGQFAGILHVAVPDEHYRSLCEALVMLPGLTVSFAEGQLSPEPAHQLMLSVTGNDRPGIVHEVASILRQLNINAAGGRAIEDPPGERNGPFGKLILAYLRDPSGNKLCALHRVV